MRDALSLLDQAIAYGHGIVSTVEVKNMLGSMAQDDVLPLMHALAAQDGKQMLTVIAELAERAPDFHQVLDEITSLLHKMTIAQVVPDRMQSNAAAAELAKRVSPEDVQLYYQIALLGKRDLAYSSIPQQGFEMTMLRMLAFKPANAGKSTAAPAPAKAAAPVQTQAAAPTPAAAPTAAAPILTEWNDILPKLGLSGMAYALASNCSLREISENMVKLILAEKHKPMLNPKLKERINEAFNTYLNRKVQLDIDISNEELITPVKQTAQDQANRLATAKQNMLNDPRVKQLVDMYDATVEVSLV
jgi:DNA polymerase-3 subunit gamma/tau